MKRMEALYKFPTSRMTDVVVNADGSFDFPDDPTQHPIVHIHDEHNNLPSCYVYRHAFVAWVDDQTQHMCRMD